MFEALALVLLPAQSCDGTELGVGITTYALCLPVGARMRLAQRDHTTIKYEINKSLIGIISGKTDIYAYRKSKVIYKTVQKFSNAELCHSAVSYVERHHGIPRRQDISTNQATYEWQTKRVLLEYTEYWESSFNCILISRRKVKLD
jgi:hypothetical protein